MNKYLEIHPASVDTM